MKQALRHTLYALNWTLTTEILPRWSELNENCVDDREWRISGSWICTAFYTVSGNNVYSFHLIIWGGLGIRYRPEVSALMQSSDIPFSPSYVSYSSIYWSITDKTSTREREEESENRENGERESDTRERVTTEIRRERERKRQCLERMREREQFICVLLL